MTPNSVTRETLFAMYDLGWALWVTYGIGFLATGIFLWGYWTRYKAWKTGRAAEGHFDDLGRRLFYAIKDWFLQAKVWHRSDAGLMHAGIFWAFFLLFLGTATYMIHERFYGFLYGKIYLYFSLILDVASVFGVVGVTIAMVRRWLLRPEKLEHTAYDTLFLALVAAILFTGVLVEGARIAVVGIPDFEIYSFFGYGIAKGIHATGMSIGAQKGVHIVLWLVHVSLSFYFIASLPFTKGEHIFNSLANIATRSHDRYPHMDTIDLEEMDDDESYGYANLEDLTWKELVSIDSCTRCGRCHERCPAVEAGTKLSPKSFILELKDHFLEKRKKGTLGKTDEENNLHSIVDKDEIWSCTTCKSCMEECPVDIDHVPLLLQMRRSLVSEQEIPADAVKTLKSLMNVMNPWGMDPSERSPWIEQEGVPLYAEQEEPPKYLWFVGCAAALDPRNRKVAVSLARLLKAANVSFGVIGEDEICCGDPGRRLGEEGIFPLQAEENIELFNEMGVKKIFTQCPHCFNILKNEYPQLGGKFEVYHHTQILSELVSSGKLKLEKPSGKEFYVHDSCYLGRYNNIYDEPRAIVNNATGKKAAEAEQGRHHAASFCCGGGGWQAFYEIEGERINKLRLKHFNLDDKQGVAVSCPYCMMMFDEAIRAEDKEDEFELKDVAELLVERLPKISQKDEDASKEEASNDEA